MAESIDRISSDLFCSENRNTCFDDLECNDEDVSGISHQNLKFNDGSPDSDNHGSDTLMGFPVQSDENVRLMVEREREHLPKDDYLKRLRGGDLGLSLRREALDWIWKAHSYFGFGPFSLCLSINYLDRFLSIYELPKDKAWLLQLLAVACLSIAAKMEEIKVPQSVDLQVGELKFVFEAKTIRRMELMVLSTLRWKMLAYTPCSFIDYFLSKINNEQNPTKSSISRAVQLILSTLRGIDFLEFRPSETAAAVAISVSEELQATGTEKATSIFLIVEKERVLKCLELIRDLSLSSISAKMGSNSALFASPQSPIGVLDAACLSYKSDELTESCPNSYHNNPNTKRSKPDKPSDGTSNSKS